jgi:O-antigen/teichoic acid export membrane protein
MLSKSKKKISELRQQPEEVRLRAAFTMSVGITIILAIIGLAILLPLQLHLNQSDNNSSLAIPEVQPQVSGLSDKNLK